MNNLIIIGNGFDLAHDLKTSYKDFIKWYLVKCMLKARKSSNKNWEDYALIIQYRQDFDGRISPDYDINLQTPQQIVDYYFDKGILNFVGKNIIDDIYYDSNYNRRHNPYLITVKSPFFSNLLESCQDAKWVDIETEYYSFLKTLLPYKSSNGNKFGIDLENLTMLNQTISFLKLELHEFLELLDTTISVPKYHEFFRSLLPAYIDEQMHVLNFNYTDTVEKYVPAIDPQQRNGSTHINYIHGRLNDEYNQMIFGFGDDTDELYKEMERSGNNNLFEHIKTFWYFRDRNYTDLLSFVNRENPFDVHVLGHSCGLTDRTLLKMIFESRYCRKIYLHYYYDSKNKFNNYTTLTYDIARHFTDKQQLRQKVVNYTGCQPMPQIEE